MFVPDFTSNNKTISNECSPSEMSDLSEITTTTNNKRKTNDSEEEIIDGKVKILISVIFHVLKLIIRIILYHLF